MDTQRKNSDDGLVIVNNIVIDGRRCKGTVVIPDGVTMIAEMAFYGPYELYSGADMQGAELTSISLPASVVEIRKMAFYQCENLKTVNLQEGITRVCAGTFWGCSALESINLPSTVTYIGMKAFMDCVALKEIIIPANVTTLHDATFSGCTSLMKLTLSASLIAVGVDEFPDNDGIVIVVPEDLKDISNFGFATLSNPVFQVVVGSSVLTYLEENNFTYNTYESMKEDKPTNDGSTNNDIENDNPMNDEKDNNTSTSNNSTNDNSTDSNNTNASQTDTKQDVYQIGKTYAVKKNMYLITAKGKVSFVGCTNKKMKKISIPATVKLGEEIYKVTTVGKGACKGYSKVTTISVGKNVTKIKDEAFMNCKKLRQITFGASVKTIGKKVLKGDKELRLVTFKGKKLTKVGKGTFVGVKVSKVTFKVPKAKNGKYVKKYKKIFKKAM